MARARRAPWIGGAVFISLLILAFGWLLGVTPRNQEARQLNEQAQTLESENQLLAAQVSALRAQFERIDEFRAEIGEIRDQIPTVADLTAFNDRIANLAEKHGVVVTEVAITDPVPFSLAKPHVVTPAPEAEASPEPGTDESAPTPSSDATTTPTEAEISAQEKLDKEIEDALKRITGFAAISVQVTIVGPYPDAEAFLQELQESRRIVLVNAVNARSEHENEGTPGTPATEEGDLTFTVAGFLYALSPLPSELDELPAVGEGTRPLPRRDEADNPFIPIEGTEQAASGSDDDNDREGD